MQSSLALTAVLMGLAGGPHCIAMCGAACAGIGLTAGERRSAALWSFQLGRIFGYSALGALAAASVQGLGWLTIQSAAMRPVWTLFHAAILVLGLLLLWKAQQPFWLEHLGRALWQRLRPLVSGPGRGIPLLLGLCWAFLPCGLLYSAVLVASMAGSPPSGALVMALFALGSGVSLLAAPWLLVKLGTKGYGDWGVRLAGLALAGSAAWALWMGLAHDAAPWCVAH